MITDQDSEYIKLLKAIRERIIFLQSELRGNLNSEGKMENGKEFSVTSPN